MGRGGAITAIEIDERLANRRGRRWRPWPHVAIVNGDGAQRSLPESDVVVASAGATHPLPAWLRCLRPGGGGRRRMRAKDVCCRHAPGARRRSRLRFLCPVWFYEFAGARDAAVSDRLAAAFAEDRGAGVDAGPHGSARRTQAAGFMARAGASRAVRLIRSNRRPETLAAAADPLHEIAIGAGAFSHLKVAGNLPRSPHALPDDSPHAGARRRDGGEFHDRDRSDDRLDRHAADRRAAWRLAALQLGVRLSC